MGYLSFIVVTSTELNEQADVRLQQSCSEAWACRRHIYGPRFMVPACEVPHISKQPGQAPAHEPDVQVARSRGSHMREHCNMIRKHPLQS